MNMNYRVIEMKEGEVYRPFGRFAICHARKGTIEAVVEDQEPLTNEDLDRIAKNIIAQRASKNRVRKTNRLRA